MRPLHSLIPHPSHFTHPDKYEAKGLDVDIGCQRERTALNNSPEAVIPGVPYPRIGLRGMWRVLVAFYEEHTSISMFPKRKVVPWPRGLDNRLFWPALHTHTHKERKPTHLTHHWRLALVHAWMDDGRSTPAAVRPHLGPILELIKEFRVQGGCVSFFESPRVI